MEEMEKCFAKGFNLTEEEQEEIVIGEEDEGEKIEEEITRSLMGTLLTEKKFRNDYLKSTIINAWRSEGKVEVKDIANNLFLFIFEHSKDKDRVMSGGPWNYDNAILVLENPNKDINPKEMEFKEVKFWVQIHNLPLRAMSKLIVEKIGRSLGNLEKVEEYEGDIKWSAFTRIRVGIDIRKPLKRGALLNLPGIGKTWVNFKYERLKKWCQWCGMIGHSEMLCGEKKNQGKGEYEDLGAEKETIKTKIFEGNHQASYSSFSNSNRSDYERKQSREDTGKSESNWRLETGNNSRIISLETTGKVLEVEDLIDTATSPIKGKQNDRNSVGIPTVVNKEIKGKMMVKMVGEKSSEKKIKKKTSRKWKAQARNVKGVEGEIFQRGKKVFDPMIIDGEELQRKKQKELTTVAFVKEPELNVTGAMTRLRYEK